MCSLWFGNSRMVKQNVKAKQNVKQNVAKRECIPCNRSRCFSCQQIIATLFESIQAKEKLNTYHKISCKINYVIYLLDCLSCEIQYVGKSETPFYIRLNNHWKNTKTLHTIKSCNILLTGTTSSINMENSY